jgi:hypothetical protein
MTGTDLFRLVAKDSAFQDIAPILGFEGNLVFPTLALSSATSTLSPLRIRDQSET